MLFVSSFNHSVENNCMDVTMWPNDHWDGLFSHRNEEGTAGTDLILVSY